MRRAAPPDKATPTRPRTSGAAAARVAAAGASSSPAKKTTATGAARNGAPLSAASPGRGKTSSGEAAVPDDDKRGGLKRAGDGEGEQEEQEGDEEDEDEQGRKRIGVLALKEGALDVQPNDERAVVFLDIDNTLYRKSTRIAELMTQRIRAYIIGLGLDEEEAERLHSQYYRSYGLAIRGLVKHHKIDALDYDAKCDATLPLEDVLRPDAGVQRLLADLDRTKVRVWALTNAYKTHAVRCLRLLGLDDFIEGIIYCDYADRNFACKPERHYYEAALDVVGMHDPARIYFVDDSRLNISAARDLGWGSCVLFDEEEQQAVTAAAPNGTANGVPDVGAQRHQAALDSAILFAQNDKDALDEEAIKAHFRTLPSAMRIRLLHIILDACLPGDIASMARTLEKHLRLTRDVVSGLPESICIKIFEKLEVKELVRCRQVSKKWLAISSQPELWRSHALALTEGDPVPVSPPKEPSEWETLVKGLYFRERNWAKGIGQSITFFTGHTGFVTAMKLRGRRTLVTGSYDETLRVWDLMTGECKKVVPAKAISCLDFLDAEGILAAGLYDTGRIMVWDMKNWSLLHTLSGHNRGIRHVAINDTFLVSVGQDKAVVVWDWKKGTKIVRFGQQSNVSLGVSIVDGDKIVAVTIDGIIRTFSIRKKELIGQYDLAKLSPKLAGLGKGDANGSNVLSWFAAHKNTITLATANLVVHLKWQEHVVPVQIEPLDLSPSRAATTTPTPSRVRKTSTSSTASTKSPTTMRQRTDSTASSVVSNLSSSKDSSTTTPLTSSKSDARRAVSGATSPSLSSSSRGKTTSNGVTRTASTPLGKKRHSYTPVTPQPWPTPPKSLTPSSSAASMAPLTPTLSSSKSPPPSALSPVSTTTTITATSDQKHRPTRIAPNLGVAPVVIDIFAMPDGATGAVDPAKRRIVSASRFSSRAGANRRLYTSTLPDEPREKEDVGDSTDEAAREATGRESESEVVPIGGAWQAQAKELAIPTRNPMSLVIDHENLVVGTSEGLVYRVGFVGATYDRGWIDEEEEKEKDLDEQLAAAQQAKEQVGHATIRDLVELREIWKDIVVPLDAPPDHPGRIKIDPIKAVGLK